jgi:hypothetical protein
MKVTAMDDRREQRGAGRKPHGDRRELRGGWLGRLARGRRFDRNPLRRSSDRVETLVLAFLVAAFLAGGPFAARAGGGIAHDLAMRVQRTQIATERLVTAVTTQVASANERGFGIIYPNVTARWTAPDGKAATGVIPVPLGSPAGTRVPVWVTLDGTLAAPPVQESQVSNLQMLGQMAGAVALVMALLVSWGLARHELDRRRYAAWDADWQATDHRGTRAN